MVSDSMTTSWKDALSVEIGDWLRENYGDGVTAPLTGTDWRALRSVVALLDLYAYTRARGLLLAYAENVREMQRSTRWMAWAIIPMALDWSDRDHVWANALGESVPAGRRAKHEPRPS